MKRFEHNPILEPIGKHAWESHQVFNAATFVDNGKVHLLYRAMGNDNISRLGLASSSDGYHFDERLPLPVFSPADETENLGCEDPRLTVIGDKLFLAYTAFGTHARHVVFQIGLTSIRIQDFINRHWRWQERILTFPGIHNKDAVLFPKKINGDYILFHRIEPDICIARSSDLKRWYDLRYVMGPRATGWDAWKIGAAGPPILLNEGWLFIYHGVSLDKVYSLGIVILDKDDPEQVLYRSEEPILTPQEQYERFGAVPNVVFSCGQALFDNQLLLYYGGGDSVMCGASYDLAEIMPKKIG
jgi:predicted GH43/DUF377 family glycosyl hydrolase